MKKHIRCLLCLSALLCADAIGAPLAALRGLQVNDDSQSAHIVLRFDTRPQYKTLILANPPRFVVDLFHTLRATRRLTSGIKNPFIKNIRTAPKEGMHYRIVFDLVAGIRRTSVQTLTADATHLAFKIHYPRWFSPQPRTPKANDASLPSPAVHHPIPSPASIIKTIDTTQRRDALIMIDPGHGGKDPGAIGVAGTKEKDIVLAAAFILHRLLNQEYGIKALLTRHDDRFVDLRERLDTARSHQADLFILLHADAFHHEGVWGASVYILSDKDTSSEAARILAQREDEAVIGDVKLEDKDNALRSTQTDTSYAALPKLEGKDNALRSTQTDASYAALPKLEDKDNAPRSTLIGLSQTAATGRAQVLSSYILAAFGRNACSRRREAGFLVLKSPDIPSVLVEIPLQWANLDLLKSPDIQSVLVEFGYLSHSEEGKSLQQSTHQAQLAAQIVASIKRYFNNYATADMTLARTTVQDYRVVKGDTLFAIAKRFNAPIRHIKRLSRISSDTIHLGQMLKVPMQK